MDKLFSLNGNAYVVTGVTTPLTTVTSTTLGAAGTWSKGATLTDASGNTFYCDSVGLYASTVVFPSATSTTAEEITNAPIMVTGNVINNFASTYTGRFSSNAYIGGNVTNGAGIILFAKNSTIGGTLTNDGTVTSTAADLAVGSLVNNGTFSIGSKQLTLTGSLSGNAIDFSNAYLKFAGTSTQTLSDTQLSTGSVNYLRVAPGAKLTTTGNITVTTELDIQSDATGTATLIDNGTITAGTTYVKQYLADARNWYVSSPVSNALAPSGYSYYRYNEASTNWTSSPVVIGDVFEKGIGYIAMPDASGSTISFKTESGGSFNKGDVDIALSYSGATKTGFNLIGNPYPAHLTWNKTFVDSLSTFIEPTIWYRTNAGTTNNSGQWSFKTYNVSSDEASPMGTTNIIPPMQAFWVRSLQAGTLTLNGRLVKSHQTSNPLKVRAATNTDRQRVRLQVSNGISTDETVIYFDGLASNGLDNYDSQKMSNNSASIPELYTTVNSEKLVINGMNSLTDNLEVPIGFTTGQANTFVIKAIEMANLSSGTQLFLKDNQSNTTTELNLNEDYSFTSDISDNASRFTLIFKSPSITTGNSFAENNLVRVFSNENNQIIVESNLNINNAAMLIHNTTGQLLQSMKLTGYLTTSTISFPTGIYFVTICIGDKKETTTLVIHN